ncbi:ATP-binding protein [Paraburkholderia sp. CNPSo 3274]|uniref:ATP-binding protein n=1 Tax=Paraburkholderia sp. CNPSo 3274 TaxID=2940932 RepID=UPI0020B65C45|nr:ATP-binding protein [Paraburkholderia sp. CNPSo 3274]MCP3705434.1 ATP-binding protein [Paraburkholderia sp. CNPSo 3274]
MTNVTFTAGTKIEKCLQIERIIYLSWVSDRLGQADQSAKDFWVKLKCYPYDAYKTPLKTIYRPRQELKPPMAGDLANARISPLMVIENMKDVTDVIAFLTDDYIAAEPHVSELVDLSQFVRRKRIEEAAWEQGSSESAEQRELAMWLILVHKMSDPREYALVADTSPDWWHELLDGNDYLRLGDVSGETLKKQLHKAATRLREHQRLGCGKCCHQHGTAGNEPDVAPRMSWFRRFFRGAT